MNPLAQIALFSTLLFVFPLTGKTTQTSCTIVFPAERCAEGNWRTYPPRTYLVFSEDGRRVTLRTNQRIPERSDPSVAFRHPANISEPLNATSTPLPTYPSLLVEIPF